MLRKLRLPLQLIAVIIFVSSFGSYFSPQAVQFFFSLSHIFKESLSLLLPFIVFAFIASGVQSLKRGAPLILLILLGAIFISNVIVATLSYAFVKFALSDSRMCVEGLNALDFNQATGSIVPFSIPKLISPGLMLILGTVVGVLLSGRSNSPIYVGITKFKRFVEAVLLRLFIPLLPVYVFGYLLEMKQSGLLELLFQYYGNTIVLIVCMHALFIIVFFVLAKGSFICGWRALKNAMPSYVTAVSTISSTATIPVTVACATKNTGNKPLSEMAVPLLANVHLMGAGINIPVLSLATLLLFKSVLPDFASYLVFVGYFCVSMFAVTGVPGAGLMVMMPILDTHFSFTPIMMSVLTTLYLLMDASSTGANVMGDGALIIMVNKVLKRLKLA